MFLPHKGITFLRNVGVQLAPDAQSNTMQILITVLNFLHAHKLDENG